jgi:hypothetical protein
MMAADQRIIDNFIKLNSTLERILNELENVSVHLENISDGIDSLQKES